MNYISREENMPGGLMNYEVGQVLDGLIERTGKSVSWITGLPNKAGHTCSYATGDVNGFRIDLALLNNEVDFEITETCGSEEDNKVVGRVSAVQPPDSRMRAILAGKAFTLYKLAEANRN